AAYTSSVLDVPLVRRRVAEVIARSGVPADSHTGKALLDVLETYPRDELLQIGTDELLPVAMAVLHLQERRQTRLFLRRDPAGLARSWTDELADALHAKHPPAEAERLLARVADAFPAAYQEDFAAVRAVADIEQLEGLDAGGMALRLWTPPDAAPAERRLTI